MQKPQHELAKVKEVVAANAFTLGRSRCLDILVTYLGEYGVCRDFTRTVVEALREDDFSKLKVLEGGDEFDEYGVQLTQDVLDRFGLERDLSTWYVSFKLMDGGQWGDEAFFISLHPLERAMFRVGGWLSPGRIRS